MFVLNKKPKIIKQSKVKSKVYLQPRYLQLKNKTSFVKEKGTKVSYKNYDRLTQYQKINSNLFTLKKMTKEKELKLKKYVREGKRGWATRTMNTLKILYNETIKTDRILKVANKFLSKGGDLTQYEPHKLEKANYLLNFVDINVINMVAMGLSSGSAGLDKRIMELIQEFNNPNELSDYLNNVEIMGVVEF